MHERPIIFVLVFVLVHENNTNCMQRILNRCAVPIYFLLATEV